MLPISQDFYQKLWNKNRPKHAGIDEYGGPKLEEELKAKYLPVIKVQERVDVIVDKLKASGGGKGSKYVVQVSQTAMAKKLEKELADGWTEHQNDKGKSYYYNPETKKTTWKRPVKQDSFV